MLHAVLILFLLGSSYYIDRKFISSRRKGPCLLAIVIPLLKKAGLELIVKNFRPVSYLPFLPKSLNRQ